MAEALMDKRNNMLKSCLKELHSCVDYINNYCDVKEEHFTVLKDIAKDYSEAEIQHDKALRARRATEDHIENQENDCTVDIQELYNKYLEDQPENSNYQSHHIWSKVNKLIKGEKAGGESNTMEIEVSDIEEGDESVDLGIVPSQFEPPIDPITKTVIKSPCKNKTCGHIYEYESIMQHLKRIKQHKTKAKCPYIGCTNTNMKSSQIVKDKALQQQIQNYLANAANTSNHSQDENDEEIL